LPELKLLEQSRMVLSIAKLNQENRTEEVSEAIIHLDYNEHNYDVRGFGN
jgi:hypothetical protein